VSTFSPADLDDNQSVWLADKPPYEPLPALVGDAAADVAVIGGGFTGVSTAYHLAKRFPEKRIVLLEAKTLANGASGRNGGLMLNWVNGAHPSDPSHAREIFDATQEGMEVIASFIRDHELAVRHRRDGALEIVTSAKKAEQAAREVEKLRAVGIPLRWLGKSELPETLRVEGAEGAILDPTAGEIDGAALVRELRPVLVRLGVGVYEQTPVLRIAEGETVSLTTPAGTVRAKAIVLATNAYTPGLGYFRSSVCTVHSHVIATEPLSVDTWRELGWGRVAGFSDDRDRLSYASLTPDGRLVFGGGSNAAYSYVFGNRPSFPGPAERSFAAIQATMLRYLPRAREVKVTHRWTGPVALTLSRICTMGVRGAHRNVYYSLGYSGHGITLANLAGRVLTDLYSGDAERWSALPFLQQRLTYIPPEPFRWIGYQFYTKLTGRSPKQTLPDSALRPSAAPPRKGST